MQNWDEMIESLSEISQLTNSEGIEKDRDMKQNLDPLRGRQILSEIRKDIKKEESKIQFNKALQEQGFHILLELLKSDDAKTRKNAALLLGDIELEESKSVLWDSYLKEEQLFVKSSYLLALSKLDYRDLLGVLKEQLSLLEKEEKTVETNKHLREEMNILSEMIVTMEGVKKHRFIGYHDSNEIILLTNRNHIDVTKRQILWDASTEFLSGLRLTTNNLDKILPIRTYQEVLFLLPNAKAVQNDPIEAAKKLIKNDIVKYLTSRHQGKTPFYFRVELKSKATLEQKSKFTKKFSATLEELSKRALINSTSNYEVQIRLVESKEGNLFVFLKLHTIEDERFSYRKEVISSSIKPVNAALFVELAKSYMIDEARVLDPFCGVGTMLIERQKVMRADTSYGIDTSADAIEKAKVNTQNAGQLAHYVNRDFFDFTHEYLFDEIFTDMPFALGRKSEEEIYEIYVKFFDCAKSFLNKNGKIIMYTHNAEYVKQLAREKGYAILKQFEIARKEGTHLFILS